MLWTTLAGRRLEGVIEISRRGAAGPSVRRGRWPGATSRTCRSGTPRSTRAGLSVDLRQNPASVCVVGEARTVQAVGGHRAGRAGRPFGSVLVKPLQTPCERVVAW